MRNFLKRFLKRLTARFKPQVPDLHPWEVSPYSFEVDWFADLPGHRSGAEARVRSQCRVSDGKL